MQGNITARTENGALSYATTGSARVDFFFKTVRGLSSESLHDFLTKSWNESPLDTLKLIFHLRDCRGGKGERQLVYDSFQWLMKNHPEDLRINLEHIPFYGSFKDWLQFLGTLEEDQMVTAFCKQLQEDKDKLSSADPKVKNSITLAAKWAPTEGCSHDTKHDAARKFAKSLKVKKVDYRRQYLAPIRAHLKLVESAMCTGQWDQIDFSRVPSCALKRYKKAFAKHSPELYTAFLEKVKTGQAKMNVGRLHPHEILKPYLEHCSSGNSSGGIHCQLDPTVEAQWIAFVDQTRKRWGEKNLGNSLAIVDVSGSMNGLPITVSVSLGVLIAQLNTGVFKNKWLTFSQSPTLEELRGNSMHEMINGMMTPAWHMNTNLQAAFDLILTTAKMYKVPQEQMVSCLYILSDMAFDEATSKHHSYYGEPKPEKTNFEEIERKYREAGYVRPKIVFWNLRAGSTVEFPVMADVPNCALVSGFSSDLLDLFLDNEPLTAFQIVRKAIDNPRYDRIKTA